MTENEKYLEWKEFVRDEELASDLSKIEGNEVCVILPYYSSVKYNPDIETEYVGNMTVSLSWRNIYAGIFKKVIILLNKIN